MSLSLSELHAGRARVVSRSRDVVFPAEVGRWVPTWEPCHHLFCPLYARSDRYCILACRAAVDCPAPPTYSAGRISLVSPGRLFSHWPAQPYSTASGPAEPRQSDLHTPTRHYQTACCSPSAVFNNTRRLSQRVALGVSTLNRHGEAYRSGNAARHAGGQDVRWHGWAAVKHGQLQQYLTRLGCELRGSHSSSSHAANCALASFFQTPTSISSCHAAVC